MIVVSNATPLISLARIDRFALLKQLFGKVHIPQAVFDETVTSGRLEGGAKGHVEEASWIEVHPVQNRLAVTRLLADLDLGEAETIVLATELDADWVLMDERRGRLELSKAGLRKVGTTGLLLQAKNAGLVPSLSPELEKLLDRGFRLSVELVSRMLDEAGESSVVE